VQHSTTLTAAQYHTNCSTVPHWTGSCSTEPHWLQHSTTLNGLVQHSTTVPHWLQHSITLNGLVQSVKLASHAGWGVSPKHQRDSPCSAGAGSWMLARPRPCSGYLGSWDCSIASVICGSGFVLHRGPCIKVIALQLATASKSAWYLIIKAPAWGIVHPPKLIALVPVWRIVHPQRLHCSAQKRFWWSQKRAWLEFRGAAATSPEFAHFVTEVSILGAHGKLKQAHWSLFPTLSNITFGALADFDGNEVFTGGWAEHSLHYSLASKVRDCRAVNGGHTQRIWKRALRSCKSMCWCLNEQRGKELGNGSCSGPMQ